MLVNWIGENIMNNFEVIEKISKLINYNSRSWNKEKIDRYL